MSVRPTLTSPWHSSRRGPLRQRFCFFVTSMLRGVNLVLLVSHIGRQDA
jgi:hypothetical protein